jgi:heme O synthase-like polyprenyltransferase
MSRQALLASFVLIPVSLSPTVIAGAGPAYFVAALALSSGFFYYAVDLALGRSRVAARRLLMISILYLPVAFFAIVLAKR